MVVALIVSILAVLFSLLDIKKVKRRFGGLEIGFLLLTIYLCIRYDYGNDYLSYLDDFAMYNSYSYSITDFETLASLQSRGDFGWVIINLLCKPLGFFGMIMLLTILFMGQIYYYIKRYVPPKWYWFSVFLFAFHPLMMVVGVAGMLRQWTVVFIFLCCVPLIRNRRLIPYIAVILAATTIHKTAYVLLPVFFVSYLNLNNKQSQLFFILFLLMWFVVAPLIPSGIIMSIFDNDQVSMYGDMIGNNSASGFGISSVLVIGMPLLCMTQIKKQSKSSQLLFLLLMLSLLIPPLIRLNSLIGRLGVYFSVFAIISYPLSLESLIKNNKKNYCTPIVIAFIVYYLYIFTEHFVDPVWYQHAYIYNTIFSVPWQ